ncbi:MAG: Rne/Rng family ribonuclease [Bryobacteraceae bacterium]
MSKELVIGSNRHETKVAVLEEDQLVEVYFQRANEYSLAGSIHKGRVTRVLPGMQSAFVDLGLERDTFLYVSDFFEEHDDIDTVDEKPSGGERRDRGSSRGGERTGGDRVPREQFSNRRNPERQEVEPAPSPEAAAEAAFPEPISPEEEGSASEPPEAVAASPDETRSAERSGEGEGFRGDRRNRRSRRRRQRGRGFPENKYAQPGETTQPPTQRTHSESAPASRPEPVQAVSLSEVVVLPGESLAKYRQTTPERATAAGQATRSISAENESKSVGLDAQGEHQSREPQFEEQHRQEPISEVDPDEAEEREAIEEEAEELDLADRILAHNDNEEVAGEDKIPEHEVAEPEAESEAASEPFSHAPEEHSSRQQGGSEFALPFETVASPAHVSEASETEPLTTFGVNAPFLGREEFFEDVEIERVEAADIDDLALDEPEHETEPGAETKAAPEESGPQSAVIRGQNDRAMHRVSRRSRRRRGGNRHGGDRTPGESFGSNGNSSAAAAPAPALESEPAKEGAFEDNRTEKSERPPLPSISDLLKPGQEIIVQIAKEPLGQKGARITSHIALPGRYVVFMPSVTHLGVSRKIASDEERQRLKKILQAHRVGTTGGFIVRTAGEGVPEEEIAADMNFLYNLWLDIRQKAEKRPAPLLLHYDLDIVQRILRDQVTPDFKAIWVDNEDMYESVLTFMQRFQPTLVNRVKMYTRSAPIFDAFNITQELEKALRPKVWLKSGGYIVINQTEALVAIDINTGKYVGKSNRLEDTIVKTNTEAVKEIVRQIRLRDLGGIIVVDFIDMDERKNRQKVMQALEEAMRADKAPYKILQFNDFGLVAITRKRVKQSLERTLCAPCPYCEGAGYVKSVQTTISEILVEAQKIAKAIDSQDVVLRVHPEVAKVLKASNNHYLEEVEEILGRPVLVTGDATLHTEKFDLA